MNSASTETSSEVDLNFEDWGSVEYRPALERMLERVSEVAQKNLSGSLVFCTHPPVVTLGRATREGDVFAWDGPTESISRGGRATYHGPSQLMVYPIVNLNRPRRDRKAQEVVGFLRALEDGIVSALAEYGVSAVGKSLRTKPSASEQEEETGVWVGDRKIASLGAAVRQWVTFHGAAINVDQDPTAFAGIHPCGFRSQTMVSLQELTGRAIDRAEFAQRLKLILLKNL